MTIDFEIYRDGARLAEYQPVGAIAVGPESVPVPGRVTFAPDAGGLLRLDPVDPGAVSGPAHPAGVGLLWDVGELGRFHLETTRLPPRPEPYNLNVELARHRMMKILQKQEDWNLFDFPGTELLAERFRAAQATLAGAMAGGDDPAAASVVADRVLADAVELSDDYARFHADLLLAKRRQTGSLPRNLYGVRADPAVRNERYRQTLAEQFDFVAVPMGWKRVQPTEDQLDLDEIDALVEHLARKRVPIVTGPLIELSEGRVPEWMFLWEHDFEALRDQAFDYVRRIVTRYRRAVSMWNVVGGIHSANAFGLSFEQMVELTRLLVAQVKTMVPGARTMVTINQPYGEYHAQPGGGAGVPPMLYAELIAQSGVTFEAFGVEVQTGAATRGRWARDLFQTSCMLDRFALVGKPVFLTDVGAPGRPDADPADASEGATDPSAAGRWGGPWDAARQAAWVEAVYPVALSKPFVESIAWADLADAGAALPGGGLLDDLLKPKPAFDAIQHLREERRQASVAKKV